jgi:ParB-like chromosome segregation protein Spo0J
MPRKRTEPELPKCPPAVRVFAPEMVPASRPNPAVYNPQEMTPDEFESLRLSIATFGFVEPLVLQRLSPLYGPLLIVGGHSRLRALRELCIEHDQALPDVPCIVLDIDDRTAKKLNIALNRIKGAPNPQKLGELLEDINTDQPITTEEVRVMGFDDESFSKYLHLGDPPVPGPTKTFGDQPSMSLKFSSVDVRAAVKAKLDELAQARAIQAGDIVFELLSRRAKK